VRVSHIGEGMMAGGSTDVFDVAVLGAGMVGVSAAYACRQRGFSTLLIDRKEPGRETSYGNAGILSSGSIAPVNTPSLWATLPKYISNRHPALRWRLGWAMSNPGWMLRFLGNATVAHTRPRAQALDGLIRNSLALHRDWISKAGASHRIRETGWLKAWRSDATASALAEQKILAEFGIASEILDRQAISALEPGIVPVYKVGLLHKDTASVDSPGAVVTAYAAMVTAAGGMFRRADINGLARSGDVWSIALSDGSVKARNIVVALGPWSSDVLMPLGYRVPLATERGYHQEFKANPARKLGRPIHDSDTGFLMTPMENGVRITTGIELAHRDATSNYAQLDAVVPVARSILEFGDAVAEPWRGARPTLPDSLPMIGPAPHHQGLWLAFGNQHIGFTTGPGTGVAIAAMIAGEQPPFDASAFAPSRYL
jgi:D-amino-acid dehydrogenase